MASDAGTAPDVEPQDFASDESGGQVTMIGQLSGLTGRPVEGGMFGAGGDSFGVGGLGLSGVGTGSAFGGGTGVGTSRSSRPQVALQSPTSAGSSLPPEIIRRIVRMNYGRLRLCYELALRSKPDLAGKVSIRFLIGEKGNVTSVADAGSTIGDPDVMACVKKVFSALQFPQPKGNAPVSVVYPILFSPGATAAADAGAAPNP